MKNYFLFKFRKVKLSILFGLMLCLMNATVGLEAKEESPEYFSHAMTSLEEAESIALKWLALIDSGDYEKAYKETSSSYKQNVSKQLFLQKVETARKPYGADLPRECKLKEFYSNKKKLENHMHISLPEGQYSVVEFRSKLEAEPSKIFIETLILRRESDGVLRIALNGFLAKPN